MVESISSLCGTGSRSLQGCLVCDRNTGIHYRICLVPLFPIKCNYGAIEPLLAFPKPGRKLQVPAQLLPSQSSLSWIVSQQCLFNQQGARCFSGLEFVLMRPMPGDHVSQAPWVTTQCFLWLRGAKQPVDGEIWFPKMPPSLTLVVSLVCLSLQRKHLAVATRDGAHYC